MSLVGRPAHSFVYIPERVENITKEFLPSFLCTKSLKRECVLSSGVISSFFRGQTRNNNNICEVVNRCIAISQPIFQLFLIAEVKDICHLISPPAFAALSIFIDFRYNRGRNIVDTDGMCVAQIYINYFGLFFYIKKKKKSIKITREN